MLQNAIRFVYTVWILNVCAGLLLLAEVSVAQGKAYGTKLWCNKYIIEVRGYVQKHWLAACQKKLIAQWGPFGPNEVTGVNEPDFALHAGGS